MLCLSFVLHALHGLSRCVQSQHHPAQSRCGRFLGRHLVQTRRWPLARQTNRRCLYCTLCLPGYRWANLMPTPACSSTFSVMQTELRAGLTTFAAMAYIISVNAAIISSGGGTCVCDSTPDDPICLKNTAYAACKVPRFRQYLTCRCRDRFSS